MDKEKKQKVQHYASRQREWQIRMREEGRCTVCGEDDYRRGYCERHYEIKMTRNLAWQAKNRERINQRARERRLMKRQEVTG